ncbi:MAG: hypothetical protein ACLR2O_16800 [Coprococcus sp.]
MKRTRVVNLTEEGVKKVEKFFHIENLADPENLEIQHNIILALRAHNLMFRDKDYVVKDDEVLIVDEFTGRIMPGRRYSDGLHQAIEAKEHVKVKRESKTLATITFQNFFNKYAEEVRYDRYRSHRGDRSSVIFTEWTLLRFPPIVLVSVIDLRMLFIKQRKRNLTRLLMQVCESS